ncbi:MAG: hypothetical protein ACJ77X_15105, partial [Chloroflexota bacterium]
MIQIDVVSRGRAMRNRSTACFHDLCSRLCHVCQFRAAPFAYASCVIDGRVAIGCHVRDFL